MTIIKARIFEQFPEIIFGFSTKHGLDRKPPYHFNLSLSVGDNPDIVWENREAFFNELSLTTKDIAFQKQVHEDTVHIITESGYHGESDAHITTATGVGLAVSSADCCTIFLYDAKNKVIAGVHSGWRSTSKKILQKAITVLCAEFSTDVKNLYAFIGPAISQKNYEVGAEVAAQFDAKYCKPKGEKFLLDVSDVNYDILVDNGVPPENIERSPLCSYDESDLLHSYRREGTHSGRAYGVIAVRKS